MLRRSLVFGPALLQHKVHVCTGHDMRTCLTCLVGWPHRTAGTCKAEGDSGGTRCTCSFVTFQWSCSTARSHFGLWTSSPPACPKYEGQILSTCAYRATVRWLVEADSRMANQSECRQVPGAHVRGSRAATKMQHAVSIVHVSSGVGNSVLVIIGVASVSSRVTPYICILSRCPVRVDVYAVDGRQTQYHSTSRTIFDDRQKSSEARS